MGIHDLPRERLLALLEDFARRWLAHDGLWFQAVEQACGMEKAIELDIKAWQEFSVLEARRIMSFLGMEPGGGLAALQEALNFRLYSLVNIQEAVITEEGALIFRMKNCRVQAARQRKRLAPFPCKPVGLAEYSSFARTIDPRIKTRCLVCPPDELPADLYCVWEFTLSK